MQFEIVTTTAQLHDFIATLDNSPISLDTEFVRTRTYLANLGLLQISQNDKITLIDPIVVGDLSPFWQAIDNKTIILHAGSEDLEIIREHKGDLNFTLFDTQTACSFLNLGASLGYAKMVETLEGVIVDKGESRTDWCARPLSDKQVNYAAVDVLHLHPCLDKLQQQLEDKNMARFFAQECASALVQKIEKQDPDDAYKSLNNVFKLEPQGLAVIKALAKWRLLTAQERNLALNFVVKADHLWLLAYYLPTSLGDLRRLHLLPNEIRIHGQQILSIIKQVLNEDESTYPPLMTRLIDLPAYKSTLKSIQDKIKNCAEEYDLPVELIASKRIINEYLSWLWELDGVQKEHSNQPKLLTGWRSELIGHQLAH